MERLVDYIADSLGTMTMVNYPYPTDFIRPLPGWPVNASCVNASKNVTIENTLFNFTDIKRLASMMSVWEGNNSCMVIGEQGGALDDDGWDV